MRRLLILALIGLIAGCGDAKRYRHFGDQLKASTSGLFGMPCSTPTAETPTRDCYRFDPPQRMSGIWYDDFEGGEFIPSGGKIRGDDRSGEQIWLDFEGVPRPFSRSEITSDKGKAYAVTLIGRLSTETETRSSTRLLVVDKWLSGREVPRPEPGDVVR